MQMSIRIEFANRPFRNVAGLIAESLSRATYVHVILDIVSDFDYGLIDNVMHLFCNYSSFYWK